jgi:hypothetical protein
VGGVQSSRRRHPCARQPGAGLPALCTLTP